MKKKYEMKNIEEIKKQAAIDFEIPEEYINFEIIKESKGFLGIGAKTEVEASICADGADMGKKYIRMILDHNGVTGFIEKKVREKSVEYNVDAGDFNGYLIGKNSRNLIALQLLVSSIVNRFYDKEEKKTVYVDVGGYKKRREKHLESMAVEWGKQAIRTSSPVKITDLNAYERKLVHNKLAVFKDVTTHSEGEGSGRVLIIEPKESKKEEEKKKKEFRDKKENKE